MTLVTQAEFARQMGWNRSSVTRAAKAGRVVLVDGMVDVEASMAKIDALASPLAHHQAHARQLEEERQRRQAEEAGRHGGQAENRPTDTIEALNLRLKRAEADKREHEADIARMEREKIAGNLIPKEDVDFVLNDFGASLRSLMENFADRYAPVIHPLQTLDEVHAALAEASEGVLAEISESMRKHAEGQS